MSKAAPEGPITDDVLESALEGRIHPSFIKRENSPAITNRDFIEALGKEIQRQREIIRQCKS